MFESYEGSNICDKETRKIGSLVFAFFLHQLNTVLLLVKGQWGGRMGGVGSGRQHTAFLAQNTLPCCCLRNLA